MNALITLPLSADQLPALPTEDIERAASYAKQDKAESTRAAYRSDFSIFRSWCATRSVCALPASPETVAGFLASEAQAGLAASTIGRRGAAIRYAHKLAGHEPRGTLSDQQDGLAEASLYQVSLDQLGEPKIELVFRHAACAHRAVRRGRVPDIHDHPKLRSVAFRNAASPPIVSRFSTRGCEGYPNQ